MRKLIILSCMVLVFFSCKSEKEKRQTLLLNGAWDIEESLDTLPPESYHHSIPVPGLVDLAKPAFDSAAYTYAVLDDDQSGQAYSGRNYFWYRKVIQLDSEPSGFAYLKVHKAKFGHAVYINGNYAGKYDFCFTPSWFEISDYLNFSGSNEILIRIGANPESLPETIPYGFDREIHKYFPGIYDRVELYMGDYPYIENIQVVPDIENKRMTAVTYLESGSHKEEVTLSWTVTEKSTGNTVASGTTSSFSMERNQKTTREIDIDIPNCQLWSPEHPFLYEIEIETPGDARKTTFGMREFRFDPESRMAMLNGKPYYLRGTNIPMHRFFEDPLRKALPWDKPWVEKMHDAFKDLHWNSHRFHVGFAPEVWYEVADEKGFLVQDEYAIWGLFMNDPDAYSTGQHERHKASVLAKEFETWMRDRWNHPSLVIWDAMNETTWKGTGRAIEKVRHLDRSGRPWDNGFSPPQRETDMLETHPYVLAFDRDHHFILKDPAWPEKNLLSYELSVHPEPFNDPNQHEPPETGRYDNATINNEYAWIWLTRDGQPTVLTEDIWNYYGEYATPEERWDWSARVVAIMTEYWRSRREFTGVHQFNALTADRNWEPRSFTGDIWKNIPELVMQPAFRKHVKPAFAPVGISIQTWDRYYSPSEKIHVPVFLINDLYEDWQGRITLEIRKEEKAVYTETIEDAAVKSLGKSAFDVELTLPSEQGSYEMIARIMMGNEPVTSSRLFRIE